MASEKASAILGVSDNDVQRAALLGTFLRAALAAFSALGMVSPRGPEKQMPSLFLN